MRNHIEIKNACIHNLKGINVEIPKGKLTVITGVSGSGKSSLAFDILYEEGKNRYLEFNGDYLRMDDNQPFDEIVGLSPTIAVGQSVTRQSNPHSTVGTRTKINYYLQMLYSLAGNKICQVCGASIGNALECKVCGEIFEPLGVSYFSRNSPLGMCLNCKGNRFDIQLDTEKILNGFGTSLRDIVSQHKAFTAKGRFDTFLKYYHLAGTEKIEDLNEDSRETFLYGSALMEFPGILTFYNSYKYQKIGKAREYTLVSNGLANVVSCKKCNGTGLGEIGLTTTIAEKHIGDLADLNIVELLSFIKGLTENEYYKTTVGSLIYNLIERLNNMIDVGLGYLSLSRSITTLSGGEIQRTFLASYLVSNLDSMIFIFDEPTMGLHEDEKHSLIRKLKKLVEDGNTVIVVEHDKNVMENADYIVDVGPLAGIKGGELIYQGEGSDFKNCLDSITGRYLYNNMPMPRKKHIRKPSKESIVLHDVSTNNLKNVTVEIPMGVLVGVAGASGSGKSSLISDTLVPILEEKIKTKHDKDNEDDEDNDIFYKPKLSKITGYEYVKDCIVVNQKPIGRAKTSNPASYIGIFDKIRSIYSGLPEAISSGFTASDFSYNVSGACPQCQGEGVLSTHVGYGVIMEVKCPMCAGLRYRPEVLTIKYNNKNIHEVLQLTVDEAIDFFSEHSSIIDTLKILQQVGMGYITLGQKSTTISGGEAQRVKLASELCKKRKKGTVYILDEPTSGLSFSDTARLMQLLDDLVTQGNTVIVIEHDPSMLSFCDYIIELGPDGGNAGGEVIAHGMVDEIISNPFSKIGKYLAI